MSCSYHFQSFALKETIALYVLNPNCSWMILFLPIKSLNMPSIPWQQTISINDTRQRNMNCFVSPNPDNTVYINITHSHMCQHLLFYLKYSAPTTLHCMTSYYKFKFRSNQTIVIIFTAVLHILTVVNWPE